MLLADFHIHTNWSDGAMPMDEVVDLFGRSGHDVIAITDHVVNSDSFIGKVTHRMKLSVTADSFARYREEIEREKKRAWDRYGMIVLAGFELTQNAVTRRNSAHVLALGVDEFISADGTVEEMLERAQQKSRIVVACHPNEQSDWFANTFYIWNRRNELAELVDLWEIACRWAPLPSGLEGEIQIRRQQRLSQTRTSLRLENAPAVREERSGDSAHAGARTRSRRHAPRAVRRGPRGVIMVASLVFAFLSLLGAIVTTVQALLVRRFRRNVIPFGDGLPSRQAVSFLSILKPVCGLDDELEENLISFTRIRGIRYEVIVSAEEWEDPALEIVRRVMRAHPFAPFRIVVDPGSRNGVVNRKVERLIAAARDANGDVLLISDSNVRIEPDDLARTMAAFDDPRVGCVSNLFTGAGAQTIGATIESLHLLSFVVPGAVLAATAGVPCVVGKSMALRREALHAIGGFERFGRVLAEDQAIGLAVKDAGYDVALSPIVVRNVIVDRTIKRAVDRQVRWNKIRYAFSHRLYAAELLLNPLVFALLALPATPLLVVCVALARCLQIAFLSRATGTAFNWRQIALTPALDLLMLYAWLVPFFSNSVTWRGYRARVGRDTELIAA